MAFKVKLNKAFDKRSNQIQRVARYKNWDLLYYPTIKGYEWLHKQGMRVGFFTKKRDALQSIKTALF